MPTQARRRPAKPVPNRYQEITNQVIAALEQGTVPWRSPVVTGQRPLAYNYVSQKQYRGINFFLLNFLRPHVQGAFLTFKQAKNLGGKVRKGAKAQRVYFFKRYYRDANGKGISETAAQELKDRGVSVDCTPFLKSFPVFNVEDVEGIDFNLPEQAEVKTFAHDPVETAEQFIAGIQNGPAIVTSTTSGNRYRTRQDTILMFPRDRYRTAADYYETLFHELTHATGHADRLAREGITEPCRLGSAKYAREELTAEMGSAFLCALNGIQPQIENSAAYIAHWLERLKNDQHLVYKAAAQAQAAVDFLRRPPTAPQET